MAKLIGRVLWFLVADVCLLAMLTAASYPQSDLADIESIRMDDFVLFDAHQLNQGTLTTETDLPWSDGYYRSYKSTIALRGTADPSETCAVRVAGRLARWSAETGLWSIGPHEDFPQTENLLPAGSCWIWMDDGSNQGGPVDGLAWYGHPDYNDIDWSGPSRAKFGYGNDGEVTTVSFGQDSGNKHITTYFRTWFDVNDVSEYALLKARVVRDDGVVVYLNGHPLPIVRDRISEEPFDYSTEADEPAVGGSEENTFYEYDVNPALLVNGINLIAAEVHQCSPTSSDLGFDLELVATRKGSPADEGIALEPGANAIVVQTFADSEGITEALETAQIDVWFDEPTIDTLSGTLLSDKVIGSHWIVTVTDDVVIPDGITLEIRAGAVILFEQNTDITVNTGGTLIAEGTPDYRILMTPNITAGRWDGINFNASGENNRLICVDMVYGDGQGRSLDIDHSRIFLDQMTWVSTNGRTPIMELHNPKAHIRNCVIPTVSSVEPVHGSGLSGDQYCIFEGNVFGLTTGYNDIIDYTDCQRPGPIVQFYNNTFLGGGDDGLDLDNADAHIEGNYFTNFHQGTPTQDSPSYAVATGDASKVCVVRNVFVDNDHCILHKEDVYSWFANNTCVDSTIADISFGEPFRTSPRRPGRGIYGDSNIFFGTAAIFEHLYDNPEDYGPIDVYMYRSILPSAWHEPLTWDRLGVEHRLGTGNIDADPLFANPNEDLTLLDGSVGIGTGANGLDMGAFVPAGATISGVGETVTAETDIILKIGGPGITHYKWRLVDDGNVGQWSQEIGLPAGVSDFPADPDNALGTLHLTDLEQGHTYRVDVIGKNSAGLWQGQSFRDTELVTPGNPQGNSSEFWTVAIIQQ